MPNYRQGDIIDNKYKIIDYIDEGAYSEIYKVVQISTGRKYALKLLKDHHDLERFRKEGNYLAKLDHPGIVHFYDANVEKQPYYLIMELIKGQKIDDYIKTKVRIKPSLCIFIIKEVLKALDYLHSNGFIHRDLKAANIMIIGGEAAPIHIKIIDLGIAKEQDGTKTIGPPIGTPAYMAPESLIAMLYTPSSDIYNLGEVLWEMMSGRRRFEDLDIDYANLTKKKIKKPIFSQFKAISESIEEKEKAYYKIALAWLKIALQPNYKKRFSDAKTALRFLEDSKFRKKFLLLRYLKEAALKVFFTFLFLLIFFFLYQHFYIHQLTDIKIQASGIIALDKGGSELWQFRVSSPIYKASILNNLSKKTKKAVIITSASSIEKNKKEEAGKIWLLNSKGKLICQKQITNVEINKGEGALYDMQFILDEDLNNDGEKELIFSFSSALFLPGGILILDSSACSVYGILWNPGSGIHSINTSIVEGKKYLTGIFTNNRLETRTIVWLPVSQPFRAITPGWSENLEALLLKISISMGLTLSTPYIRPNISIIGLYPDDFKTEIKKIKGKYAIIAKSKNHNFIYDFEGFPFNHKAQKSNNYLSPTELLWKLNIYYTYIEKKLYSNAIELCETLLSQAPDLPILKALLYMLLGKAQAASGNIEKAIQNYQLSLASQKEGNRAIIYLFEQLILQRRLEEAKKIIQKSEAGSNLIGISNSIDYSHDAKRYYIYLSYLENKYEQAEKMIDSITPWAISEVYRGFLKEQYLTYKGDKSEVPLDFYGKYEISEKFWRWRLVREVLVMNKPLSEAFSKIPQEFYQDIGLKAVECLAKKDYLSNCLAPLEESAEHNLEDALFLPAVYLLYAKSAYEESNQRLAKHYARKALAATPLGFLKTQALSYLK